MLGYNRMTGYNKARYNAEGSEIQKADSFTSSDSTITRENTKPLSDLFVTSDSQAKQQNKSVTETIKLDVWQSQDRKDSNLWGD